MDFLKMMKQAKQMQEKMGSLQEAFANIETEGTSGGGLVKITIAGKGEIRSLKIDPSLFKEDDVDVLEDLIIAAHADAKAKSEAEMQRKMSEVTAGLPIPPGMKFPF